MDTTAKVDIRKLQLLNDRIAQTIDALNQVRLSVHALGLSHTTAAVPGVVPGGFGQGYSAFGAQVPYAAGIGQQTYGAWPGVGAGIAHSSPYGYWNQGQVFGSTVSPLQQIQQNPMLAQLLLQQSLAGGLSHTSDVWGTYGQSAPHTLDPITATRIMQMFPFAQLPISPVG